ncbi:olfactory receptor 5AR1-like [Rhinophrynus dorsalis]
MEWAEQNLTDFSKFYLVGFSDIPRWNPLFFMVFIFSYLVTLLGNGAIILLILLDSSLHNPMYFFLCNLSFLDICCTSVTAPEAIDMLSSKNYRIPFSNCISQVYFYLVFTNAEFFLLPVMAYDRYVAICKPLHYHVLMSKRVCVSLAVGSWTFGFLDTLSYTLLSSRLVYCKSHVVNHFFCDLTVLMKLSCSDTSTIELITFIEGVLFGLTPLFLTLTSYLHIIISILKIHTVEGRSKAFSTCSSHLTVITLFYGTIIFMYMRPTSEYSPAQDKLFAVYYTTAIPMINPFIYSLRNRDVKNAFKKVILGGMCH